MQQTSVQKTKKIKEKLGGMNMFKKMKHIKNEKGLTLIELLAVIVILAIIAAIAIPAIGNIINNQRDKAVLAELSNAISSAELAYVDGTCGSTCASATFGFVEKKAQGIEVEGLNTTNPTIKFTNEATVFKKDKFKVSSGVSKSVLLNTMDKGN